MDRKKSNVLFIENEKAHLSSAADADGEGRVPYDHFAAASVSEAREILDTQKIDVIISDYAIGNESVFDVFVLADRIPVIVVTGSDDVSAAVKAMKAGAYDYITKDKEQNYLRILPLTIENAIKHRKSENRLRLLESAVMNANDAIIILEAEPGQMIGRRILYVNEAFTRMTGYTYEEATSQTLRILRGPKTSLAALDRIRAALEEVKPVRVELINYRKDGSEFWVECNIVPFADKGGSFIHWVSVQRDITERKQADEERERLMKEIETINSHLTELNQELETIGTERTMSLMALTVADRVRNPASMIGARCRRILEKEDISSGLRESLHCILEGADDLDRIVRDFETLLKNRQSRFKHHDLNKIVEGVVSVIEKEASFKGITLSIKICVEPLRINMQQDLLRVALFHIMKNAVEATADGGMIKIETFKAGDQVGIIVSDTGYGIPQDEVENIFKPFFSTKERGFGMGLPLVRQIITEHLGDLVVSSRPNEGTSFKVLFPVRWKEEKLYCEQLLYH